MYFWCMLTLTVVTVIAAQSDKDRDMSSDNLRSQIPKSVNILSRHLPSAERNRVDSETKADEIDYTINERHKRKKHRLSKRAAYEEFESKDTISIKNNSIKITNQQHSAVSDGESKFVKYLTRKENEKCEISIPRESIRYFQNQLLTNEPHFVQFRIKLYRNKTINSTKDVFQSGRWYWTYNTSSGPFPFLSWNLDYGLLTFGLLDAKTILVPYIYLNVSDGCDLTYGSNHTSFQIATALKSLVNFSEENLEFPKYLESFFCFLVTNEELRGTLRYYASLYFIFPSPFIRYKCCTVKYSFKSKGLYSSCRNEPFTSVGKWSQTSLVQYILGILLLAFSPIPMFQFFAWTAKHDKVIQDDYDQFHDMLGENFHLMEDENDWIFADGISSPLSFFDLFSFDVFGLYVKYPILMSRVRRLVSLAFAPLVIYIQFAWYTRGIGVWHDDDKITVKDLVEVGTPMGFLSLFADPLDKYKTFVPGLGGTLGVTCMYFSIGFLFIVLPKCLKQIVEDGLPKANLYIPSPLFFGFEEILKMSKIRVDQGQLEPGYRKGATMMKCSFYLLFTTKFWNRLWRIQVHRIKCFAEHPSFFNCALFIVVFPLYFVFCILEILLCLVYYGIPFCFFVVVMIKGTSRALSYLRNQNSFCSWLFRFKVFVFVGVTLVFILFSLFAYITGLLIMKSFGIILQVIRLCLIAVVIYPSVSFGYLFFFVMVLYYFIKQVRNFADVYTELLSTAVDISKANTQEPYNVTLLEGYLTITNLNCENLKGVRINGNILNDSHEIDMIQNSRTPETIRKRNNAFGIPRDLFEFLVKTHRPVHQQFLTLVFRVSIMIAFILLFFSISSNYASGPTSEISEVMHVTFVVVVGVIPQLIVIAFSNSNSVLVREIDERNIEQSIDEYWSRK